MLRPAFRAFYFGVALFNRSASLEPLAALWALILVNRHPSTSILPGRPACLLNASYLRLVQRKRTDGSR